MLCESERVLARLDRDRPANLASVRVYGMKVCNAVLDKNRAACEPPLHWKIHIIEFPSGWNIVGVFADFGEIVFVSDDVCPVVSLPEFASKGLSTSFFHPINIPFCGHRFEAMYNIRQ